MTSDGIRHGWRTRLVIRQGDLTEVATDAIVNAANTDLLLGGSVAGAIARKGGPAIQRECDAIGSIPLGEAAITSGGGLKARFVIHAAGMHLGAMATEAGIRDSTRNSMRRASQRRLESIAFPAIGTGIAGFPMDRCAALMLAEIRGHLSGPTTIRRVEIVLFDQPALEVFQLALQSMTD